MGNQCNSPTRRALRVSNSPPHTPGKSRQVALTGETASSMALGSESPFRYMPRLDLDDEYGLSGSGKKYYSSSFDESLLSFGVDEDFALYGKRFRTKRVRSTLELGFA